MDPIGLEYESKIGYGPRRGESKGALTNQQRKQMTAQEALDRFKQRAAAGQVVSLKSREKGPIARGTQAGIESAFRSAITFAAQKCDLNEIRYAAFADALDQFAMADAKERGLRDPAGLANKCRRFVATVDGKPKKRSRHGEAAIPDAWLNLYRLLQDHERERGERPRNASSLARLARTAAIKGVLAPAHLPSTNKMKEWALGDESLSQAQIDTMLSAYRLARTLYLQSNPEADLPDIDRCPILHERGLRSLPDIVERLDRVGYTGPISGIDPVEVIRLLAPRWYEVMCAYIKEHEAERSNSFAKKVIGASSRFLATLVQSGHGELMTAHPTPLLVKMIDTGEIIEEEVLGGEEWAEELFADLGIEIDEDEGGAVTREVRLIAALAHEAAYQSAQNSPLVLLDDRTGDDGPPFWAFAVIEDTRVVGELGLYAGRRTPHFRKQPALLHDADAALKEILRSMREANSKKRFANRKAKEKLLNLVTFPMILCLGIPALRRQVLAAREAVYAAMIRYPNTPDHRRIESAVNEYDRLLTAYMVFVVFTADGLRLANYTRARLGPLGRERMVERRASDGTIVRSYCHVLPVLAAGKDSLVGVETNFYGDDHKAVKLKIDKVPGSDEWRQHPHWLRPGIVDMDLAWEYLTGTRARRLGKLGLIPSVDEYDLERDVSEWNFALFVSDTPSTRPYHAVTGAYSEQSISESYGRTLYWICTEVLGRDLPEFGPELTRQYPECFGAHPSRLLAGTYIYGVLGRKMDAATLLNDTTNMVERRYSVTEASMVHKRGWEHPNYFDDYFRRIWDDGEVIDWDREDPLKSIPLHERPRLLQ